MKRAVLLLVLLSSVAHADHGDENGLGLAQPLSLFGLQFDGGDFRLPQGNGRYLTTTVRADFAPSQAMSLGIRIPYQVLQLQGGGTRNGLGDVVLLLKLGLLTHRDGVITLGLAASLPTGSPELGLGSGRVELNPYLRANMWFDFFVVQVSLADRIAVGGGPRLTEYIDPHSDHELNYQLGFGVVLVKQLQLLAVANGVTVLAAADRWQTLATVGPQARWSITDHWQIVGGAQFPVFGPHRTEWRANAALQFIF